MTAAALANLAQLNAEAADYLQAVSPAAAWALRDAFWFAACADKLEGNAEAVTAVSGEPSALRDTDAGA